ncbi:MAG: hypothetical protein J5I90_08260 [Caldilineales bacterium]|nr:hypothetical protein [Caldilineales bacterium]
MNRRKLIIFTIALMPALPFLSTAIRSEAAPSQPAGWVTLMSEDFEGVFPSDHWHIGREGDPYLWGQRNCNPHAGTYSMWGGGGGTQGSQIPCTGMYTTGYATTLSYGPFDLSGCTDVRVNFAHWTWLSDTDSLGVGYSIDGGKVWHLIPLTGNAVSICDGWCEESFSKERWPIQLCGQPKVYLLFRFASNSAGVSYGAFVDDVSLEALYEITPSTTPTATGSPTLTATLTPTLTPTATSTRTATASATPTKLRDLYLPLMIKAT